jgi:hypothetical protein
LVPDLAATCPDAAKRGELLAVHRTAFEAEGKAQVRVFVVVVFLEGRGGNIVKVTLGEGGGWIVEGAQQKDKREWADWRRRCCEVAGGGGRTAGRPLLCHS